MSLVRLFRIASEAVRFAEGRGAVRSMGGTGRPWCVAEEPMCIEAPSPPMTWINGVAGFAAGCHCAIICWDRAALGGKHAGLATARFEWKHDSAMRRGKMLGGVRTGQA